MGTAFASAVCLNWTKSRTVSALCGVRRVAPVSPVRYGLRGLRAGLYPDADTLDDIPDPDDKSKKVSNSGKGKGKESTNGKKQPYQSPSDVMEPDVLKRARDLFGGVYQEEEKRVTSRGDTPEAKPAEVPIASNPFADDAQKWSPAAASPSAQSQAVKPDAPDDGEKKGWFEKIRRKLDGAEEVPQATPASPGVKQSSEAPTLAYSWAPDEIDVAATEGIKRDEEEAARSGVELNRPPAPIDIQRSSRALWKVGWWTWWVQLVLTTIASVIVLFAFAFPGVNIRSTASAPGFVCAGAGVALALVSLIWTYGYTRLAIRLRRSQPKWIVKAPESLASYLRLGLVIALSGLFVSLLGLQAIVGTLLARLFGAGIATTPYATLQAGAANTAVLGGLGAVQPVDVLVIQASANAMSALLTAVVSATWFRGRLRAWTVRK